MNPPHVVVQAGGRGSRLRRHTWNKPKCLVSVGGKPILYHLFDRFSQARFREQARKRPGVAPRPFDLQKR